MGKGKRQRKNIIIAKGKRQKDKHYNDQRKNDKSTNNIMAKGKRQKEKHYNDQRKNDKSTNNIMAKGKMTHGQTI